LLTHTDTRTWPDAMTREHSCSSSRQSTVALTHSPNQAETYTHTHLRRHLTQRHLTHLTHLTQRQTDRHAGEERQTERQQRETAATDSSDRPWSFDPDVCPGSSRTLMLSPLTALSALCVCVCVCVCVSGRRAALASPLILTSCPLGKRATSVELLLSSYFCRATSVELLLSSYFCRATSVCQAISNHSINIESLNLYPNQH